MSRTVRFRPEAEAEVIETRDWYENRQRGLGKQFRETLETTLAGIIDNPLRFPRVHDDIRRAVLLRFPYAIYFRLSGRDVVVLAVHGRQHQRRWQSRT